MVSFEIFICSRTIWIQQGDEISATTVSHRHETLFAMENYN